MRSFWRLGALAGSAGALAAILVGLVLAPLAVVPTLPELVLDRIVRLTPGPVFGLLIDRLQYAGRPLLYSGLLLAELVALAVAGALVGGLMSRMDGPSVRASRQRQAIRIVALTIALWLLVGLVALPLAGLGVFASASRFASGAILWGYLLEALVYSVVTLTLLTGMVGGSAPEQAGSAVEVDPLRRALAGSVAAGAVATLGGVALWRYRAEQAPLRAAAAAVPAAPPPSAAVAAATEAAAPAGTAPALAAASVTTTAAAPVTALPVAASSASVTTASATTSGASSAAPLVTPNAAFYVVSKNLVDPVVQADDWQLTVKGMVQKPLTLRYQQLLALPSVEQYRTLECISNDVGGSLMSNALWRGIPLASLLDQAGADGSAAVVLFKSVDGYTESLPMSVARQPTTLIAHQMNGVPLPPEHGFPARVILAGRYGMKNPKWLTEITVAKENSQGFWEQQGWDEQAIVRTNSRIDAPKDGTTLSTAPTTISGVAFAGDRGIKSVQVQVQPGGDWEEATVQPAVGMSTWVAWTYRWQPPRAGSYQIRVRAIDGTGKVQEAQEADSYPDGAAGLHFINVQVR